MTLSRHFHVVVACSLDNGIGVGHRIPWRIPRDLAHFERVSSEIVQDAYPAHYRNALIMGRTSYLGIPAKKRPLAGRLTVVLSNNEAFIDTLPEGVLSAQSLEAAMDLLARQTDIAEVFICGGTRLYEEAIVHPACKHVYLTRVHTHVPDATAHFPALFSQDAASMAAAGWRRCTHAEFQADMMKRRRQPQHPTTDDARYDDYPEGMLTNEKDGLAFEFQMYKRIPPTS